jgi:nanoRNase/pAp phosphatase (c-di-AMP/oligoRNAs hydrolase)
MHGIESTLLSFFEVSHQENRALVKRLDLNLVLYHDRFDLDEYSLYAFVDSQKVETPIQEELEDKTFLVFVDHHKKLGDIAAEFVDIREDAGSTCAIFADYLRAAYPQGLNPNDPDHVKLATALMHGIRSDTRSLLEASRLDFVAAAYLWPAVDQALLRKISAQSLNPAVMDMIQAALERKRIYDNFLFSDVGFVRREHRDGIPQAADFLLSREGTDTVLVFGIVDGRTVDGSLRTRSDTINPDAFLKKAFGIDEETGSHYGGGNVRDKGGFQIPLGFLAQHKDREQLYRLASEVLHEKFLEAIGRLEPKI